MAAGYGNGFGIHSDFPDKMLKTPVLFFHPPYPRRAETRLFPIGSRIAQTLNVLEHIALEANYLSARI
jgi:hypothetical protein